MASSADFSAQLKGAIGHDQLQLVALPLTLLDRVTASRQLHASHSAALPPERAGFWHRWALLVMRRPVLIVLRTGVGDDWVA
jgi:uncharacterized membrane protein YdfJ with MMPL/SSD domain